MTGNVLIKNRTPSSDVPYLFGLPKQKQRFCAIQAFCAAKPWWRANSLRPSILISCRNPKNRRFCAVQAFCAAKPWRRANSLRPSILISCRNPKKRSQHTLCPLFWSGRRGSLAALPCRDTHSGRQTPHRGVFSLRSRPVRPSARWNQKIKACPTSCLYFLERATRLELATSTLARWRSTR